MERDERTWYHGLIDPPDDPIFHLSKDGITPLCRKRWSLKSGGMPGWMLSDRHKCCRCMAIK